MLFRTKIRRGPDGAVHVSISTKRSEGCCDRWPTSCVTSSAEEPEDPSLRRLFPTAHEDPEREGEYRELTRGQLVTGRQRSLEVLEATADSRLLTPEEADAWLRALNDARLVLGTRLDITEDYDWDALDTTTPRAPELALYAYLSWLQEQLVEAM